MMPNGLPLGYRQWGTATTGTNTNQNRQWGFYNCNRSASFPLTFTSNTYRAVATIMASTTDINNYTVSIEQGSTGTFTLNGWRNGTKQSDIYASVVVLGK